MGWGEGAIAAEGVIFAKQKDVAGAGEQGQGARQEEDVAVLVVHFFDEAAEGGGDKEAEEGTDDAAGGGDAGKAGAGEQALGDGGGAGDIAAGDDGMEGQGDEEGGGIGGEEIAISGDGGVEGGEEKAQAQGMEAIGEDAQGIGQQEGDAVGNGDAFAVEVIAHLYAAGVIDGEGVDGGEGQAAQGGGEEEGQEEGIAVAFLEVGKDGQEHIEGGAARLFGGRGRVLAFADFDAHGGHRQTVEKAQADQQELEVSIGFTHEPVVEDDAGNQADSAEKAEETADKFRGDHIID